MTTSTSAPPAATKHTPLTEAHRKLGAKLIDFGGWSMPVSYASGILNEHRATRTAVGVFDVCHMGEVHFRGPRAAEAVQRLITNDVGRLAEGARALHRGLPAVGRDRRRSDRLPLRRGALPDRRQRREPRQGRRLVPDARGDRLRHRRRVRSDRPDRVPGTAGRAGARDADQLAAGVVAALRGDRPRRDRGRRRVGGPHRLYRRGRVRDLLRGRRRRSTLGSADRSGQRRRRRARGAGGARHPAARGAAALCTATTWTRPPPPSKRGWAGSSSWMAPTSSAATRYAPSRQPGSRASWPAS